MERLDIKPTIILLFLTGGMAEFSSKIYQNYGLKLSLDTVKTSVAFLVFSAGSIVLINLGGYFIFKEEISKKNKFAIGLIVIALVLMNI